MSATDTVPPEAPTMACPRCGAANAGGAMFCASCGGSMTTAPPPPPVPPPQPPLRPSGSGGHRVTLAITPEAAFDAAMAALAAAGSEVTWQSRPNAAKFGFSYKSFWFTGGVKVSYLGDLSVSPVGPGQTQVGLTLAVNWGGAVPLFVFYAVFALVMWAMNPAAGMFFGLCAVIGAISTAWRLSSKTPEDEARKILQHLGPNVVAGAYAPPAGVQPAPPPPKPAPPPPQAAAPPPVNPAVETSVFDQIKRLAELRDMGAVTPEEFDTKKSELLKRL
jgi:hypothetical protein